MADDYIVLRVHNVEAESKTDIIEEMADLLEVIRSLAHVFEIPLQQIEEQCLKKEKERGGFNDRVYIEYVEASEGNTHIDYLSSRPSQYHEVDN